MEGEHSRVELRIGQSKIMLTGSEDFISKELSTILDKVDLHVNQPTPHTDGVENFVNEKKTDEESRETQKSDERDAAAFDYVVQLQSVADKLSIDVDQIGQYFYVEDENIHLHDPYSIPPEYALIGYCLIKEEFTGKNIFDNSGTKNKLVEDMRVPIKDWGGTFLHNLRKNNIIKDDPRSEKSRNVPFKITPTAEQNFQNWLNTNEDD